MTKIRANSNNTRSRKNFTNNRNNNTRILQTASNNPTGNKQNKRINPTSIQTGKMLHQQQQQPQQHANSSNFKAATNSNLVNINNLNYGTPANNMYRVNNNSKKINSKPNKQQSGRNSFSSGIVVPQPTSTLQTPPFVQFNNTQPNSRYQGGQRGPATRNMTTRRQTQPQQTSQHQINPLMMFQPIQTPTVLNDVTVNLTRDEPRLVIFNSSLNNQTSQPISNKFHFNNNKFNSNYHQFQFHPKQQHNQQANANTSHSFNPFNRPSQVRTRSYYKNLRTQLQLSGNTNSKFQHQHGGVMIPSASGKFKAPYNTTQYIMFDYSRRMPALKDLQCPSEQQQFDNDWDMAMLQEALTPSATFKPIIMPGATMINDDDSDDEVELLYMDPNHAPIKKSTSESQLLLESQTGDSHRMLADTPMTTDDDKQLLSTSI